MTPMTGLQILGLDIIATSDYDKTKIEDEPSKFRLIWTNADILPN